jgi:GAF domain-containing protein
MTVLSPAILLLGAALAGSLFWSILSRAKRDAEVRVLLVMSGCLCLQLICYAAAGLLDGSSHRPAGAITAAGDVLSILLIPLITHFIGLTYLRVSSDREGEAAYSLGLSERKFNFLTITSVMYAFSAGRIVWRFLPFAGGHPDFWEGFAGGFLASFGPVMQLMVIAEIERRMPEERRNKWLEKIMHVFVSPRLQEQHWEELSIRPDALRRAPAGVEDLSAELKGFAALLVWYVFALLLFAVKSSVTSLGPDYAAAWLLASRLTFALAILPLVYYKAQFLFFDVVVKRGVAICALFVLAVIYFMLFSQAWIGAVVLAAVWGPLHRALERALDRHLFRRPNYAAILKRIGDEAPRFVEDGPLLDYASKELREALAAEFVRFRDAADTEAPGSSATAPMSTPERNWGCFDLGKRARNQPYRSEDLQFISAVAAITAAMLDNFARQRQLKDQQQREAELRELAARSELKALRAQINPHFLFNALNTLAYLTRSDPKVAENVVLALAAMFRFVLDATRREEVKLSEEIEFIRSYLEIEQARFGSKLRYSIDMPAELGDYPIPPMLIQPLVENAVRHGISPQPAGGCVSVRASLRDDLLSITVEDDGAGFSRDGQSGKYAGHGIGLANVRERVARISGAGRFCVRSAPGEGTSISFEIAPRQTPAEREYADHHR